MMNYVYILLCNDGSWYTGWTTDPIKRFRQHKTGKGARYTKMHEPLKIIYLESFEDKKDAMAREWHIKQMSRAEKEKLIFGSSIEKDC